MRHKINKITEDEMLSKMIGLGMIKKVDFGYVQAYDDDGRLWSKTRAAMTLYIEFGYKETAHHVSTGFMKKFNKVSEENLIKWERLVHDSRTLPNRRNKRRDCEFDLGFDTDLCPIPLRLNIQKHWLKINQIEDEEKKRYRIEHYRILLRRKHPEIFPDFNQVEPTRQTESLESILATSGALFRNFSNGNCYDYDHNGQSYDEALNEYR